MTITINGTTGITNDGGYTGDGVVFADTTPANTLVTTTGGNVGVGTSSPSAAKLVVRSGTGTAHTVLGNDYGSLYLETTSGGPNRITSLNSALNAGQALAFNGSGGTEWGRFDTSGNLLVGTTVQPFGSAPGIALIKEATTGKLQIGVSTTSSTDVSLFYNPGGIVGKINLSGSATTYSTSSDYRLKEDIAPMTGALAKVSALKPVTYKWKSTGEADEGFIAHELAEVCPSAVVGEKDAMDAEGKPVYQGIDTSFLVATLTAAIQEQQAIITALTARVAALEGTQP